MQDGSVRDMLDDSVRDVLYGSVWDMVMRKDIAGDMHDGSVRLIRYTRTQRMLTIHFKLKTKRGSRRVCINFCKL